MGHYKSVFCSNSKMDVWLIAAIVTAALIPVFGLFICVVTMILGIPYVSKNDHGVPNKDTRMRRLRLLIPDSINKL